MKKTFRKAALSTFCMLIVAVVSLTGVTYAWFTSAKNAQVEGFQFDVAAASGGIEISLDNNSWSNKVTPTTPGTNYNPVSTVGELTGNKLNFFTATLNLDDTTKLDSITATENGYYVLSIYVRNSGGTAQNVSMANTTITAADTADKSELAARFAIVSYESISEDTDWTGDVSDFANKNALTSVIYEPNATKHTPTGINDAKKQYTANSAQYPNDTAKYITYGVEGTNATTISKYTPAEGVLSEQTTNDITAKAFTVNAGEIIKIDLYVWLEGQDNDCDNRIAGHNFNVNVNFAAEDAE